MTTLVYRQAALVLSTVKRDGHESRGEAWPEESQAEYEAAIREQYELQGNPYYASARLWDDGMIDPRDTREVLAYTLGICQEGDKRVVNTSTFGIARF